MTLVGTTFSKITWFRQILNKNEHCFPSFYLNVSHPHRPIYGTNLNIAWPNIYYIRSGLKNRHAHLWINEKIQIETLILIEDMVNNKILMQLEMIMLNCSMHDTFNQELRCETQYNPETLKKNCSYKCSPFLTSNKNVPTIRSWK